MVIIILLVIVAIILIAKNAETSQTRRQSMSNNPRGRTIYYRTTDGRADYGFSFERQLDGSIRPFIISMPSYGNRDTSLSVTHRLTDGGRYYVCWTRRLYNEADVKQVVSLWADLTQTYIRTGLTIDEQMIQRR